MIKTLRRLLKPLLAAASVLVMLVALGFAERRSDRTPVVELRLDIAHAGEAGFVSADDLRRRVLHDHAGLIGRAMGAVDLPAIEADLRAIPAVAAADAWHTMDGVLHVRVLQREPVVRVINTDGSGFYIDRQGWTFPLSDAFTARVLVVAGELREPFAQGVHPSALPDSLARLTRIDEIHRLALFIGADPLWNALIDHATVNAAGEFELIPRIGMQRIMIGDGGELETRFARLREFYTKGIVQAGWRRYARIDVRFADQVVCTVKQQAAGTDSK